VLEEAAKIGLYSLDFFGRQWLAPSGLGTALAFEELFWGDAGIGLSLTGTCLAAVALSSNGSPEQAGEWLPQMFGGQEMSSWAHSARQSPRPAAT
jgi:alkylation response protein AidB-like acyl-CoA dehydrogenase